MNKINNFEGDLGIFNGSIVDMRNSIGQMDNPEQQAIAQTILMNLEDFGRAQTGAAIQDFESKNFKKILPSLYDGKELTEAKIESFSNMLKLDVNSTLKYKLGDSVFEDVFGEEKQPEVDEVVEEDEDISYFNQATQVVQETEERSFFDNL